MGLPILIMFLNLKGELSEVCVLAPVLTMTKVQKSGGLLNANLLRHMRRAAGEHV